MPMVGRGTGAVVKNWDGRKWGNNSQCGMGLGGMGTPYLTVPIPSHSHPISCGNPIPFVPMQALGKVRQCPSSHNDAALLRCCPHTTHTPHTKEAGTVNVGHGQCWRTNATPLIVVTAPAPKFNNETIESNAIHRNPRELANAHQSSESSGGRCTTYLRLVCRKQY